jgi:hypothetical protein
MDGGTSNGHHEKKKEQYSKLKKSVPGVDLGKNGGGIVVMLGLAILHAETVRPKGPIAVSSAGWSVIRWI